MQGDLDARRARRERVDGRLGSAEVGGRDRADQFAERIELDQTSELTDARVVECARESIFSVQLPNLEGYGRLQVTSRHQFDGQQLTDEDAPDPGGV